MTALQQMESANTGSCVSFAEIEVSLRGLQSSTLLKESFGESCSRDFCGLELLNIRIKVWLIPVSNSRELEDVRFLGLDCLQ